MMTLIIVTFICFLTFLIDIFILVDMKHKEDKIKDKYKDFL